MKDKRQSSVWVKAAVLIFWLAVWQGATYLIHNKILLAGPADVLLRLFEELGKRSFYLSVAGTLCRILAGFFSGLLAGLVFGSLAYRFRMVKLFLEPVVAAMKAIPVAAFVVLVLIWAGSKNLAVPIAFLVVFPYIYINTWTGLSQTPKDMLEMAESFSMRRMNRILHIYRPALMPYLLSAVRVTIGMAFKSGIAAEVIGIPEFSIGEKMYLSKIYLDTEGVLAWTVVVLLLSFLCEKGILALLEWLGSARICVLCGSREKQPEQERARCFAFAPMEKMYESGTRIQTPELILSQCDRVGVMGESGCGKTTWFRLLLLQDHVKAASVFQEDRLCASYSAVDNVKMVCLKENEEQIRQALQELLPGEALDRPVDQLSGGMRRRVAVVRACLAGGNLLLMDEPFTGLDEENRERTAAFILAHQDGRSLLFTTHQENDIALFDAKCVQFAKKN